MKNKFLKALQVWDGFYDLIVFKIAPIIAIILFTTIGVPSIYKSFVDKNYCVGSKENYKRSFEKKVNMKIVESIYHKEYTSIYCIGDVATYEILSCAIYSKGNERLPIEKIKIGDTVYKEENSNEFSLIRNGKKITFDIDVNRDVNGSVK